MSNNYPVFSFYKTSDCNVKSLKQYSVQYDNEKMQQFLEQIKDRYSQTYRTYGTAEDISKLQEYSLMDSTFDEKNTKDRIAYKIIEEKRNGQPNLLHYRYTKYPAIYKLLKNSLKQQFFELDIFSQYFEAIKNDNNYLYTYSKMIKIITNKTTTDFIFDKYFENKPIEIYTDKERNINQEEYKKIIQNFFSLLEFKNKSKNIVYSDEYAIAMENNSNLKKELIENSKLVKSLKRKKYLI